VTIGRAFALCRATVAALVILSSPAVAQTQEQGVIILEGVLIDAPPVADCPVEGELAQNFRWLHDDSPQSVRSAAARKTILRAMSVTLMGDVGKIRAAYKEGQQHNQPAARLIDRCSDLKVRQIAQNFAETVVRIKSCGDPPPAQSATCPDMTENLRWSLVDSGSCAPYAREWLSRAMKTSDLLKTRAEAVRRGLQAAQGHRPDIAASADFLADPLLVKLAEAVYQSTNAAGLDRREGNPQNPIARSACPGILLFNKYE
jgi:hypothetical protein